jgi:hypothetical protein
MTSFSKWLKGSIALAVSLQMAACGTILYPDRRGQRGDRLDIGVVLLDGVGLLFFIIPGVIAYAVDFTNGTIYLPGSKATKASLDRRDLKRVKFDAKHFSPELVKQIILKETGYDLNWKDERLLAVRLTNQAELPICFAQARETTALQSRLFGGGSERPKLD